MLPPLIITLDLSTTACKAIAWGPRGQLIAQGRAPLQMLRPAANAYEQAPEAWWAAAQEALRQLFAEVPARGVAALAITTQRESVALTGADDQPLRPAMLWLDERRKAEVSALCQRLPNLHAVSGKPCDWSPAVFSLAWLARHEPALFAQVRHVYDPHAWLVRQLTGEFATSWASACPFGCFDITHYRWADEVLQALPLAASHFPPAQAPGSLLGEVSAAAAASTGLPAGTPLIAGGGDGQAGGLGSGVVRPGLAYLNLGTAIVSGVYSPSARIAPAFRTLCALDREGYILETSLRSGTLLISSLLRQFFNIDLAQQPERLPRLERRAARVPAGSGGLLLLPYWNGVMNPHWDADARGCLLGLSPDHGRGHLYRAVLEGIALEQALATHAVEAATGQAVQAFVAMGGGAASRLWCQIFANICDRPLLRAATQEASSLGAGMAAAVGVGWYSSFGEAAAAMAPSGERFEPHAALRGFHQELLGLYRDLYPSVRALYPRLARLAAGPGTP
ncbi:FGGY family carbohydrate kinase [Pseudomonas sp. NPDC007930]|uniref:xylulokinase n=1 Tax=Pseudomonas sp. NPDC007930 TaxID=3364417 RepID=UPI0036EB94FF